MLIATGVMTCASMAPAMADNLAPTETKIEIGKDASASGQGSVAIGQKAVASNLVAIAIGRDAVASGEDSIAIGSDTKATQNYSVAVGNDIGFTAYAGTAVGQQAYASGDNATAIGTMTNIDAKYNASHDDWRKAGAQSTAIGAYAGSWGLASTAVGGFSKAEGRLATAIGYNSQANVDYGTALGDHSEVKAGWGVAIGASSVADRESHVVGLYAPDEDKDSLTWKANAGAVSVGSSVEGKEITRQITNVAAGSADTDAVNVAQLNAVKAAAGKKVSLVDGENTKATLVKDDATGTQYKVDVDLSKYAKTEDVAVVYDQNKTSLRSTNASVAENAIALGKGASAVKDSVAIGNGASVVVGSNGVSGVALGNKAHAGYKGTSLGSNAISGREGTTLVGANTNSGSLYTTVVGTDSVINSSGVKYLGMVNVQGATATVVGSKNTVDNQNNKVYSGVANNIMGAANTIKSSNGITIQGSGNTVTDAYKDMDIDLWGDGFAILGGDYSVLAKKQSGAIAVVGGANTVSKQTDSTVIGYDNQLIGDEKKGSHDVFMAGSHNRLNNVSDSIVMGNKNVITGVSNVISFGHQNEITANNAVAIGSGAGVSAEGGVALGAGSVADRANAVSVGSKGAERQIINVAAGTADTDAVNVSQLNAVKETANKGWNLYTNGVATEATNVKPGEYVGFSGDKNISVSHDGTKVKVELNDELKDIKSISNGNKTISLDGTALLLKNGDATLAIAKGAAGMQNGAGASVVLNGTQTVINGGVTFDHTGKITNVKAGEADTDAVNVSQLNAVKETANKGWNLSTNGGEASKVAPDATVDFSGDKNISVSHDGTKVQVKLNENIDVNSIKTNALNSKYNLSVGTMAENGIMPFLVNSTGAFYAANNNFSVDKYGKVIATAGEIGNVVLQNGVYTGNSALRDGELYLGDASGNYSQITTTGAKLGQVTIAADGKISGVAAGAITETSTDAVNGSQLHAVKTELQTSDKHLVGNPASADGYYKPDANGDISLRVEDQNKNGYDVVIKDVASKAELGDVANRVTNVENKVTQIETDVTTIKTDITTIKTDINNINTRVDNVEALAGKHTTLEKNGTNINVEETVVDGQKNYKVNLNKDITLGDENGNKVSISGTNGTITATGDITTANRINAANGGKLADIDVTGNKLSNGNSSITLDGTNVKVNDKVTVDKDGKISGVAAGAITETSTDAVNGSQLYDTNTHITNVENQVISNSNRINQLGNRVNKVGAGAAALAALHPMDFDPDDKLTFSAGYGNYGGENAAAIGAYYRPDEKVMFSVAGTVGNGENMVNAGVSFALDRTNHVSNSRTALAREVIDLRGQLAVMGAKMAKMEKAFGMLDETKTKLFPDVPANHWAYEYIAKLAGNGYIEGYPDGNFGGDRLMTRYEFAAMLYRAIEKGAALEEKIIKEFEPELGRIRVDRISGEDGDRDKIERVRVNDTKGERDHYGNKLAK